ncbi:hypothetical protein [Clostridium sp. JS66]|uniref:toxin-antitoxin system YwqK family antitoxin n=1 Tax=Clostridium sp. JS66 TaxID=3064705 RepID=UPI00298E1E48|nr:hypothetical protein [Clostridium sp. JS66]WPC43404.1 hypothetical protein Q6H37_08010 [Clostridium sp. JS66]
MEFKITEGLNMISIGLGEIGSYLNFHNPISVTWYDCSGSVGKYLCLLPYNKNYRKELRNRIIDSLNGDFSDNIEGLHEILKPLFQLFPNGNYSLNFYNSSEKAFFAYKTSNDNYSNVHYEDWKIIFSEKDTDIENTEKIKTSYEKYLIEKAKNNGFVPSILEYSTSGFYDGYYKALIATQPFSEINKERVAYFEKEIKKGNRPAAIIYNCYLKEQDDESADFVLDGHHKLLAYQNLKIHPPIIEIKYLPQSRDEVYFNIEKLIQCLYPWQIEHILSHWEDKEEYFSEVLQNSNSSIHNFIKNGQVREFYKNGQLKHEAYYINDKIHGESRGWFDNGQLQYEHFYNNGIKIGLWKDWYKSGKIQYVQPFNDEGKYNGHLVSYYENGQIRWEEFLKNGINEDGVSYLSWFENGNKEAELKYLGGRMVERKK